MVADGHYLFYYAFPLCYIGTKPTLSPHDGGRQFGLSGNRTDDHPHANPELYHRQIALLVKGL